MQFRDKTRSGLKFGVAANRQANLMARAIEEGHWKVGCFRPSGLTDPQKLIDHFALSCQEAKRALDGLITHKTIGRLTRFYRRRSPLLLRELDSILFGGGQRWETAYQNLVVNEGLDHLLDVVLSGGTQDTTWFGGLLASSPSPLAGWTATEVGSNDFTAYDETTLPAWVDGGVSSQSVTNSSNPFQFTISTNGSTIGGAFLIGTNAKATPAGTLYAAGAFSGGNKSADDNDTLDVTATLSSAAA